MERKIDCAICDSKANLIIRKEKITFKAEKLDVTNCFYKCEKNGHEFVTEEQMNLNVAEINKKYHDKKKEKNNSPRIWGVSRNIENSGRLSEEYDNIFFGSAKTNQWEIHSTKNQHVVPYHGKWAIKGAGNEKYTSIHDTQKDAINKAKSIAFNQRSEVVIHRRDGQIRSMDGVRSSLESNRSKKK